ncbi:MAG: FeoB small GTPase domain-containing protein, partial [Sphingobacterium sp.]
MKNPNIVLVGNPNVGKTSIFNRLTKLNQKVGNYPGITVEKREGSLHANDKIYHIIDLPGTYTLFPNSLDEEIVFKILSEKENKHYPDLAIVVAEPASLNRSIILYLQIRELGVPAIFVINMIDELKSKGIHIDFDQLERYLKTKVYTTNARSGEGLEKLIKDLDQTPPLLLGTFNINNEYRAAMEEAKKLFPLATEYLTWQYLAQDEVTHLDSEKKEELKEIRVKYKLQISEMQKSESLDRHD